MKRQYTTQRGDAQARSDLLTSIFLYEI